MTNQIIVISAFQNPRSGILQTPMLSHNMRGNGLMVNTLELVYSVKEALKMTTEEFGECAELFSNSYGRYSQESPIRPGENVKMGLAFFERR